MPRASRICRHHNIPHTEYGSLPAKKIRHFGRPAKKYRKACQSIDASTPWLGVLMLWMLTIGVMSDFNPEDEDWLVKSWNEVSKTIPGVRLGRTPGHI